MCFLLKKLFSRVFGNWLLNSFSLMVPRQRQTSADNQHDWPRIHGSAPVFHASISLYCCYLLLKTQLTFRNIILNPALTLERCNDPWKMLFAVFVWSIMMWIIHLEDGFIAYYFCCPQAKLEKHSSVRPRKSWCTLKNCFHHTNCMFTCVWLRKCYKSFKSDGPGV